jgi:hypothetical protein
MVAGMITINSQDVHVLLDPVANIPLYNINLLVNWICQNTNQLKG